MYREMDMRFWLEQAETEMSGLAWGHGAPTQPPSVYDQNPRFQPWRKLAILRGL